MYTFQFILKKLFFTSVNNTNIIILILLSFGIKVYLAE